jgi:TonB family protein
MKKHGLKIAVVLSLLLHAMLGTGLLFSPDFRSSLTHKKPLELDLVDAAELLKRMQKDANGQIIEQNEKAINDEVPEDAKYLSRHNQKIVRETKAALNDKFRNSQASGGKPQAQQQPALPETPKEVAEKSERKKKQPHLLSNANGLKAYPSLQDLKPDFHLARKPTPTVAAGGGEGPSATDDHIKNVPIGMETMLSTREFIYYSYYNRIKDKLRQYWEPKIKEKMERVFREGRTIASTSEKITKIVIVLDSSGTLIRVQVIGASGVTDLDDAAVEAFRAAAPFPNPPKGIVEQDGTIKIRWDFILEA